METETSIEQTALKKVQEHIKAELKEHSSFPEKYNDGSFGFPYEDARNEIRKLYPFLDVAEIWFYSSNPKLTGCSLEVYLPIPDDPKKRGLLVSRVPKFHEANHTKGDNVYCVDLKYIPTQLAYVGKQLDELRHNSIAHLLVHTQPTIGIGDPLLSGMREDYSEVGLMDN